MHDESSYQNLHDLISQRVLYDDNEIIAVDKPPTVPVVPDKTGDPSLLDFIEEYCGHPLKVVHRIDRPCSGIVIFAKSKHSAIVLSQQFKEHSLIKRYLAVVGKTKKLPPHMHLEDKLYHNRRHNKSYVRSWMEDGGKIAILDYELIDAIKKYALLEVDLKTGRHHQIRAQLSHMGYPIKGDVKYGFKRGNKDRSIQLHAWKITFQHPDSEKNITLRVAPPLSDVWRFFDLPIDGY